MKMMGDFPRLATLFSVQLWKIAVPERLVMRVSVFAWHRPPRETGDLSLSDWTPGWARPSATPAGVPDHERGGQRNLHWSDYANPGRN
jgi:hypothetical protein